MNTAVQRLEDEVRQLIRQRGVDPQRDPEGAKNLIGEVITDYDLRSLRGSVPRLEDVDTVAKTLHDLIIGFGPLQPFLDDDSIEEIWINEPSLVLDRKSTRLNSSHVAISYAVFCLKKKTNAR